MRILFVALLMGMGLSVAGQQYIYFQKDNDIPHKRIAKHEEVTFRPADEKEWIKGRLQEINEESITVNNRIYPLKKIEAFKTHHELVYLGGTAMGAAGLLFTGIAFFNRLINGDRPLLTEGQMIFGAGMIAGGLLVRWLARKTYEKEDGWQWKVIDLNKDLDESGE